MTMREADIKLHAIADRKARDYRAQAALHGVTIETKAEAPEVKITDAQKAELERISKMSIADRRKAFG